MKNTMQQVTFTSGIEKRDIKPSLLLEKLKTLADPLRIDVCRVFCNSKSDLLYKITLKTPSRAALKHFILEAETLADGETPDETEVDDLINYIYSEA